VHRRERHPHRSLAGTEPARHVQNPNPDHEPGFGERRAVLGREGLEQIDRVARARRPEPPLDAMHDPAHGSGRRSLGERLQVREEFACHVAREREQPSLEAATRAGPELVGVQQAHVGSRNLRAARDGPHRTPRRRMHNPPARFQDQRLVRRVDDRVHPPRRALGRGHLAGVDGHACRHPRELREGVVRIDPQEPIVLRRATPRPWHQLGPQVVTYRTARDRR
jgi:hypothetical protein